MATTFHRFPFLPWELRARIWELTVEPRTVEVHTITYGSEEDSETQAEDGEPHRRLVSTTPVPATLHTCREARNLGLYQKEFSEFEDVPEGREKRYVWLNLDIDMIDIGQEELKRYRPIAKSIKRLKYRARTFEYDDVSWLHMFESLAEAHIDCFNEEGLNDWYWTFAPFQLRCDHRNILLIESENGRTITAQELEEEYDRREQEALEEFADADPVPVSEMLAGLDIASMLPKLMSFAEIARNMEDND